jgi:hypothetical protein
VKTAVLTGILVALALATATSGGEAARRDSVGRRRKAFEMRRPAVALCAAFLILFVPGAGYSALGYSDYGTGTYSPGEQQGGSYDCPYSSRHWILNGFAKTASRNGKSIFIDNSGHWIGVAEDASTYTLLYRPDLEGWTKKGSVKNTSAYTYSGHATQGYDNTRWCV